MTKRKSLGIRVVLLSIVLAGSLWSVMERTWWSDGQGANMPSGEVDVIDLAGADLRKNNLERGHLLGANLKWADLRQANLKKTNLNRKDLAGANLEDADLPFLGLAPPGDGC